MSQNLISKNISIYRDKKIYDSEILRHIGIETYSTLLRMEPNLYKLFLECKTTQKKVDGVNIEYTRPKQLQLILMETNLSGVEIKTQILAHIYLLKYTKEDENIQILEEIKNLHKSSTIPKRILKLSKNEEIYTLIFFIIFISIIVVIILVIYNINTNPLNIGIKNPIGKF